MKNNPVIKEISESIVKLCSPEKIILISYKTDNYNELTSFKLALIVSDDIESMPELECSLYMKIDSEIPFDLVFYSVSEWNELKERVNTFAYKINNTGAVLYE